MARLVLTGASGYIGQRLVELARGDGHQLVVLGRHPPEGNAVFFSWNLGEEAPQAALAGADAVIHLAHSWAADSQIGENPNRLAAENLARQSLAAGIKRFVFASTTSARANARNSYGRVKFAAENALARLPDAAGRVVCARIALVYGGEPAGQYALMRKLTALTPVLPMLGLDRQVQPIHLDEVCRALLTLALDPDLDDPFYVVGGEAISFAQWLQILRRVQKGDRLRLMAIPPAPMVMASRIFPFLRERVQGLLGAEAMPSRASLAALGLVPGDPLALLSREEKLPVEKEPAALLAYLGANPVSAAMERDLAAGLVGAGLAPVGLSPLLCEHPALLALCEPPANRQAHRLGQALYLAAQVIEAHGGPRPRPGLLKTGCLVLLDLLLLPVRLLAGRRYR